MTDDLIPWRKEVIVRRSPRVERLRVEDGEELIAIY
jgi:hypothetical protein